MPAKGSGIHKAVFGGIELKLSRFDWEHTLGIGPTRLSSMLRKYNTMQGVIDNCPELNRRRQSMVIRRGFYYPKSNEVTLI